jgi:hypothetical protein
VEARLAVSRPIPLQVVHVGSFINTVAVTYLDPKGPASIDPHNTFAHSVIQEAIGGAYCQASGHPPPSNRTQLAWLESAATAAVHRNPTFQSVTPNRPFVFHHGESPSHGSTLVNNRFTRVYPPDSRAQTKKDEEATAKILGLERTATGWKYKEGTLVPGKNGQIVGIQKAHGTVDLFPQRDCDEMMESWLEGVWHGSVESALGRSFASSKGESTWLR